MKRQTRSNNNNRFAITLLLLATQLLALALAYGSPTTDAVIPEHPFSVPEQAPYNTPLTQWVEFPDIKVARFDLSEVNIQDLLEDIASSTTFRDITFDATLDGCPVLPGRDVKTPIAEHIRKYVTEVQDGKQSPKVLFKPREPTSSRPPRVNTELQQVWSKALDTSVNGRLTRDTLFPRNFFPLPREADVRERNFWRVNKLEDEEYLRYPYSAIVRVETVDSQGRVVTCTGTVVGVSTVLTAPECVYGSKLPPVILTGYNDHSFRHAFLTDEIWVPSNYDPCTFYYDGWASFPLTGSPYNVPVPSKGAFALLHIARNALKKEGFYVEIGDLTGTLGLGAVYLPDLATFPGYDSARNDAESLNLLEANVELVFNEEAGEFKELAPGRQVDVGFYNDWFNVEGDWEARGAPAIVNLGPAYPEDLQLDPAFWYKQRGVVSGVVSRFYHEIPDYVDPEVPETNNTFRCAYGPVVSSSGSMFGVDFVAFLYEYCYAVCESACDIDHACGNGRVDEPQKEFGNRPDLNNLEFYPPWYLPEQCDMGFLLNNELPNSLCRSDCTLARCGDGITDDCPPDGRTPEECDGSISCTPDCKLIAPRAEDDFYVTPSNTPITFNVTINDRNIDPDSTTYIINVGQNGQVQNIGGGNFTYTPETGFSGVDTFDYKVCDSVFEDANCDQATVYITVQLTAAPNTAYVPHRGGVPVTVISNSQDPRCVSIAQQPETGSATVNALGQTVYNASQTTYVVQDTFIYQVCVTDGQGGCSANCANATVTIYVVLARDDAYSMNQAGGTITFNPTLNDTNIGANTISVSPSNQPSGATVLAIGAGSLSYTPLNSYAGTDTFTYRICAPTGSACVTAVVTVVVRIKANNVQRTINEGADIDIDVLVGNFGSGLTSCTAVSGAGPALGTATRLGSGLIRYSDTAATYHSQDTFLYRTCASADCSSNCDVATVTINLNPIPTTAAPNTATVTQTSPLTVVSNLNVLSNDFTFNRPATVVISTNPPTGDATVNSDNTVNWSGPSNFAGNVQFSYTVCRVVPSSNCATTTVTITVLITAAPVSATFTQASGSYSPINVVANNLGGNIAFPVTVTTPNHGATAAPNGGNAFVQYTPLDSFAGVETFNYTVCVFGQGSNCASNVVTVLVHITARNQTVTLNEGGASDVDVLVQNPGSGIASCTTVASSPTFGSATGSSSALVNYVDSASSYHATDTFLYKTCASADCTSNCATAFVNVILNTIPVVANPDSFSVIQTLGGTSLSSLDVVSNDDTFSRPSVVTIVGGSATVGSATANGDNTVNWSGVQSYAGLLTFSYQNCRVNPSTNCATATVTIRVNITANNVSASFTQASGSYSPIDVVVNNLGGHATPAQVCASAPPDHGGAAEVTTGTNVQYTPLDSFAGMERFKYRVCAAGGPADNCATAWVICTVQIVVNNYTLNTGSGRNVTQDVLAANPGSGLASTITIAAPPSHGVIVVVNTGNGEVTYRPNSDFSGVDTFRYRVCAFAPVDNCAIGWVFVNVGIDVRPWEQTVLENSALNSVNVVGNNLPGATLPPVTIPTPSAFGSTITPQPDGSVLYTPPNGFAGTDTFEYNICAIPPVVSCGSALVNMTVQIIVTPQAYTITQTTDLSYLANVLAADPGSGDSSKLSVLEQPAAGTGTVALESGEIRYTPPATYAGFTYFRYTTCAATPNNNCAANRVNMTVLISAVNDAATTNENTNVVINVLGNDPGSGVPSSVSVTNGPSTGTTSVNAANGAITFSPQAGFAGVDTFTYRVCAATPASNCATAVVTVTVLLIVDDDTASTSQVAVAPATTIAIDVLANDAQLTVLNTASLVVLSPPTHGTTTVSSGKINYQPQFSFAGDDTFTYKVCVVGSSVNCGNATVSVRVNILALDRYYEIQQDRFLSTGTLDQVNLLVGTAVGEVTDAKLFGPASNTPNPVTLSGDYSYYWTTGFTFEVELGEEFAWDYVSAPEEEPLFRYATFLELNDNQFQYQLCAPTTTTPNCDTATVTVFVKIAAAQLSRTLLFGSTILVDMFGQEPNTGAEVDHSSLAFTGSQGAIGTTSYNTASGILTYTAPVFRPQAASALLNYTLCAVAYPTNCDTTAYVAFSHTQISG